MFIRLSLSLPQMLFRRPLRFYVPLSDSAKTSSNNPSTWISGCWGDLPTELRNTIYELVLISAEPIIMIIRRINGSMSAQPRDNPSDSPVGFLHTCKAINAEAQPIFYGDNTFEILTKEVGAAELLDIFLNNMTVMGKLALASEDRCQYRHAALLWNQL